MFSTDEIMAPRDAAKFIADHSQDVHIVQEGVTNSAKQVPSHTFIAIHQTIVTVTLFLVY